MHSDELFSKSLKQPETEITREKAMKIFKSIRAQANKDFPEGMSLDVINLEIYQARDMQE